jgi:outer membrane usher protein
LLGVAINGLDQSANAMFLMKSGILYIGAEDLRAWRVRRPAAGGTTYDGAAYFPVTVLGGATVSIDQQTQTARFTLPAELFESTSISAHHSDIAEPTGGGFSAFVNYDFALQRDSTGIGLGGVLESGMSNDWGLLFNSAADTSSPSKQRTVRLDTYYLRDDPQGLTRLIVGDSITRGADWSRPARFGGVQFGTDFGLQPNFLSYPTPDFSGRAILPSTVEAFANGVLRYQGAVDQGPFSLNQVPVVTGGGTLQMVVRDQLGGERTIMTPYYVSSRLMKEGLSDYSFEAGAERQDFDLRSFGYRAPFAAGTYRYGLSSSTTVESHAEFSGYSQTAGAGLAWVWPALGEFAMSAAGSRSGTGTGGLGKISFARIERWVSLSASYTRATDRFEQLGIDRPADRILSETQATAGLSLGDYGSINATYGALRYGDASHIAVESANYTVSLFGRAYLDAFILSSRSNGVPELGSTVHGRSTTVGFSLTIPFGGRSSASTRAYSQDRRLTENAEWNLQPPTDSGIGYRLSASRGGSHQDVGDLIWRSGFGEFAGEVGQSNGALAERVTASGGIGYIVGKVFASRRIEDGFGAVSVPGYPNVTIYQDNRPIAQTDADGDAVIPTLRAYQANRISIETNNLPIDAKIDTDALRVVPRYRGGVVARFPVTASSGASLVLVKPDGALLPPGVPIKVGDRAEAAFTGYDGAVFLIGVAGGETLTANWAGGNCTAILPPILSKDKLPELGRIICRPVVAS